MARECLARRSPSRLCFSQFATRTVDNTVDLYAAKPDIYPEPSFLPIPPAFDTPVRGGSHQNIAIPFGMKKLEWLGYPMVEKFWRCLYSFWHNSRTWWTNRHTYRQTLHDDIGHAYASHRAAKTSKNHHLLLCATGTSKIVVWCFDVPVMSFCWLEMTVKALT